MPDPTPAPPRNLLSEEDSPYLLQHASNPVAWLPWGEPAFARARLEDKPVFLSIGYSTCHWCHVMEHESFENPAIAEFLNAHFISIKVDREERPDVDLTYMTYVQAVTGHGGWPMSVFLTPDAKPFFGGTYFPPDDRHGRTGFKHLLERIAELWLHQKDALCDQANRAVAQIQHQENTPNQDMGALDAPAIARHCADALAAQFDREFGGFGRAPKFPRPAAPTFLLEFAQHFPDLPAAAHARTMALSSLRAMAQGGIYDQIGGGFHRYAVDRIWHIPHYEKMLYDQAQLVALYTAAYTSTGDSTFLSVIEGVIGYVVRDLRHPEGGFFSAEDADSLPDGSSPVKREGAFYVWSATEIGQILNPELAALCALAYGIRDEGNADPASDPHGELEGTNTLFCALPVADLAVRLNRPEETILDMLVTVRDALFAQRALRPRPHLDDKIVCGWNGMMLGALAMAGRFCQRPEWIAHARQAARFLHQHLWQAEAGRLFRSCRTKRAATPAFASDHAQLVAGLLDLYTATGELTWLEWALQIQESMDRCHRDATDGTYFSAQADGALGILSLKDDHDGAEPSANAQAALNLLRLGQLLHHEGYANQARQIITQQQSQLVTQPQLSPLMVLAAMRLEHNAGSAILYPSDHPDVPALAAALQSQAPADTAIVYLPASGPDRTWWLDHIPWLATLPTQTESPVVIFCQNQTCAAPLYTVADITRTFATQRSSNALS